jgi:hypothetical protein
MKKYKIDGLTPSSIITFDAKYHFETRIIGQDGFYYSSHFSKNSVAVSGTKSKPFVMGDWPHTSLVHAGKDTAINVTGMKNQKNTFSPCTFYPLMKIPRKRSEK